MKARSRGYPAPDRRGHKRFAKAEQRDRFAPKMRTDARLLRDLIDITNFLPALVLLRGGDIHRSAEQRRGQDR